MEKIRETDGCHKGKPIFCPVNGWDCPYYDGGKCFIRDPMEDCDDFASMFDSWEDWEELQHGLLNPCYFAHTCA